MGGTRLAGRSLVRRFFTFSCIMVESHEDQIDNWTCGEAIENFVKMTTFPALIFFHTRDKNGWCNCSLVFFNSSRYRDAYVCHCASGSSNGSPEPSLIHDDVIKWKHFPRYRLALCEGNPPVNGGFPSHGQRRGALMFSLICSWINGCWNNRKVSGLRRYRGNYDVSVMSCSNVGSY